jgi:hypothetical protein
MTRNLTPDDYYRAARRLLPDMDDAMRQVVEDLLKRSEGGEQTDNRVVEVIAENRALRKKLREALDLDEERTLGGTFSQLAGAINPPDARKYICPVVDHDYTRRVQKAGDHPGSCPIHQVPLIPIDQKVGK